MVRKLAGLGTPNQDLLSLQPLWDWGQDPPPCCVCPQLGASPQGGSSHGDNPSRRQKEATGAHETATRFTSTFGTTTATPCSPSPPQQGGDRALPPRSPGSRARRFWGHPAPGITWRVSLGQVRLGVPGEGQGGRLVEVSHEEDADGAAEEEGGHDEEADAVDHPPHQDPLLVLLWAHIEGALRACPRRP